MVRIAGSLRWSVYRAVSSSKFLIYAEWARMNADMRAIYVAGAYDALIAFAMSNQQRPSTPIIATKSSLEPEGNRLAAAFNDLEPRFRSLVVELVGGITRD